MSGKTIAVLATLDTTRIASADTPIPCAVSLERAYLPSVGAIAAAARKLVVR